MNQNDMHRFQKQGVNHIIQNESAALFMEMGLGKTVTTLTSVNFLMYEYLETNKTLIVAPLRVARQVWSEEVEKWDHLKHLKVSKILGTERERKKALLVKADIYIINVDNIGWLVGQYPVSAWPFDTVVFDESDSFKSASSARFKVIKIVLSKIKRVILLTGTPQPHSMLDLWSQLYLMDRGERLGKTITEYKKTYFNSQKVYGAPDSVMKYDAQTGAEQVIYEKISDICLSMKAEDYLQLPEKRLIRVSVPMTDTLKARYDDFEREKVLELLDAEDITVQNAAALSTKLLQFANGAVYDEERNVREVHNLKIDALHEIMEHGNGEPVLLFYSFKHDLIRIQKYFKKYKPRHLKDEKDFNDWNAGKIKLGCGHARSMGHGLNLQSGGRIIVFFGPTWNLGLKLQAIARLYRQGQKKPVIVHQLCLTGSIDERVLLSNESRDDAQKELMNYCNALKRKYQQ